MLNVIAVINFAFLIKFLSTAIKNCIYKSTFTTKKYIVTAPQKPNSSTVVFVYKRNFQTALSVDNYYNN